MSACSVRELVGEMNGKSGVSLWVPPTIEYSMRASPGRRCVQRQLVVSRTA
jgi:hypothetical protein